MRARAIVMAVLVLKFPGDDSELPGLLTKH